ncbi:TolC family protein [Rheinheimera sediminis]|uniref:TolC family protein n=1 Tax=Rheinheimera sp. YQF-1 TaxID=2499626 RepID=UPI001646D09B|nr:TolC family protein [Rheinheimera sp. YQF-1]
MNIITKLSPLAAAVLLSACAGTSGFNTVDLVQQQAAEQQVQLPQTDPALRSEAEQEIDRLLAEPLTQQSISRIAVLNNPDFLAALSSLAIGKAQLTQAGLLPNPGFRLTRSRSEEGYNTELDFSLNLFNLIFLNKNKAIAQQQAQQQQQQVSLQLMDLLIKSRIAFIEAVVAQQRFSYLQTVQEAIDASAELANRMYQVGNYSELQQARQLKFAAEIRLQLAKTQQQQQQSREQLYLLLGLSASETALQLPAFLPAIPATLPLQHNLEQQALAQRLDLQQAKAKLAQLELQLEVEKNSRFVRGLSAEIAGSVQHSAERELALGVELPLFDSGAARTSKAEAEYLQARWQTKALEQKASFEVRQAYALQQSSYQIARHYQEQLVPLAQKINQQNMLRYNGMLIGVFELIADTQAQVETVTGQMTAQRDFYLSELRLQQALWGSPSLPLTTETDTKNSAANAAGH